MKKIALAAMVALALASCSSNSDLNNDVTPSNNEAKQTPVSFGTYVGRTTRGGATGDQTSKTLQTAGFGVIAYHGGTWATIKSATAPNFMYNEKVYGANWITDTKYFWPNTDADKVNFFAYAPYTEVTAKSGEAKDATSGITALSSNAAKGDPTVTYSLGDANAAQVDLMYGVKNNSDATSFNTDLTKSSNSGKVDFLFKHALAKIGGVTIKANPDDYSTTIGVNTFITVKEIKIEGVAASTYTTGTLDLATGTWTLGSAATDNKTYYDLTSDGTGAAALNPAIAEPTTFSTTNTPSYVTTTAQSVFGSSSTSGYIIPAGADQTLKVTITYVVRTISSNLGKGYNEVTNPITNTVTFKGGFAANKAYTLNISLGLTSVKFTASVSDWATSTDSETQTVELPALVTK